MIAIAGALVLLTGGSLFLFGRSITVPLALLTRAAKKLAIGDVEVENDLPHPSRDASREHHAQRHAFPRYRLTAFSVLSRENQRSPV
jgi:hypothetical protein